MLKIKKQSLVIPYKSSWRLRGFTLIELLVVIAIIGLLAVIALISLNNARANARDAKRLADMKQMQTALALYYDSAGRYPSAAEIASGKISFYSPSTGTTTYMEVIPSAPMPADGPCSSADTTYTYDAPADGSTYTISFCISKKNGDLPAGRLTAWSGGISPAQGSSIPDGSCIPSCSSNTCVDNGCGTLCACDSGYDCSGGVCVAQVSNSVYAGRIDGNDALSSLLYNPKSAFISGSYAYVISSANNALEILDISNPSHLAHVGSIKHGGSAKLNNPSSIFVVGGYAYVTSLGSKALEIINVSDPTHPAHAGSIADDSNGYGYGSGASLDAPQSVFVSGNYAYIASYNSNALEVINISTPSAPTHAGKIANGSGGASLSNPQAVFVSGNYAYVTSYGSNALEIVDISTPSAPTHAGKIANGSGGALLNNPRSVFVSGNYAYIASYGSNALEVINISTPSAPTHAGSLSNGSGGASLASPVYISVSGSRAYLVNSTTNSLEIADVSDPAAPTHAGSLSHDINGAWLQNPQSVMVSGNYAYVASYGSNAVEVVNVSNPSAPVHYSLAYNGSSGPYFYAPRSVTISGNYAYLSNFSDFVSIINISDPNNPTYVSSITNGTNGAAISSPYAVSIVGNYAYIPGGNGLDIEDISNPAIPKHVGSVAPGWAMTDVYVSGSYAYAITSYSMQVIDISNPANPVMVRNFLYNNTYAHPTSIFVSGNYAYITDNSRRSLEIIDISNPSAPVLAGEISDTYYNGYGDGSNALLNVPSAVVVRDNYAYVVSGSNYVNNSQTLEILDVSDKSNPVHHSSYMIGQNRGGYSWTMNPTDIAIVGNYAYIICSEYGYNGGFLETVDISNPDSPQHVKSVNNGTDGVSFRGPQAIAVSGTHAYVPNYSSNSFEVLNLFN